MAFHEPTRVDFTGARGTRSTEFTSGGKLRTSSKCGVERASDSIKSRTILSAKSERELPRTGASNPKASDPYVRAVDPVPNSFAENGAKRWKDRPSNIEHVLSRSMATVS